jgi:glycerol-3-phosphate dehydrogenase
VTKKLLDTYVFSGIICKGKHFFLVPYRNFTLIGTTDKEFKGNPDHYKVTKQSVMELIDDVNAFFGKSDFLTYEDVLYTYGGLRPLVEDQTEDVYRSSRKYEITGELKNGIAGLITVEGGKYTTSRRLAEKAINKVVRISKAGKNKSISRNEFLVNCDIPDFEQFVIEIRNRYPFLNQHQAEYLCKSYGRELDMVFDMASGHDEFLKPFNDDGENAAQIVYACRYEWAQTLPDILFRRTGIALLGHPGKDIIEKTARIAAKELSWDEIRIRDEIKRTEALLKLPE